MTEAEWLAFDTPGNLLLVRGGRKRSTRKLRLFSVACCRRGWSLLTDPRSRRAVEAHELHADKRIDEQELDEADAGAAEVVREGLAAGGLPSPDFVAAQAVGWLHTRRQARYASNTMAYAARGYSAIEAGEGWADGRYYQVDRSGTVYHPATIAEFKVQADLYRDIFPFHSPKIDPAWLSWDGGTVANLARTIYDDRAFARMPILSDALEAAGCSDAKILAHCRAETGHVRGCWVVDSLLGRA